MLFGTARAWRTKLDQRLRPLGLSQGKWRTLIHLSLGGNKLTQKEIAERMGIEEPTLAGLLDRLQEDGWIERRDRPTIGDARLSISNARSKRVLEKIFNTAHGLRHELIEDIPQRRSGSLHSCPHADPEEGGGTCGRREKWPRREQPAQRSVDNNLP